MRGQTACRLICLLLLVACGDDPVAPPAYVPPYGPLALTLSVDPDTMPPGHSALVRVVASLPADQTLSDFRLRLTGFGDTSEIELPILESGPHAYLVTLDVLRVPIEGDLHLLATAQVGGASDSAVSAASEAVLTIWDDGLPFLAITAPRAVEPPDSLSYTYQASDYSELDSLFVRVLNAAGSALDSVTIRQQAGFIAGGRGAWVPPGTPLGDSIVVEGIAYDLFERATTVRRVVRVADTTPPALTVHVDTVPHPSLSCQCPPLVFVPGDTIRFHITGADRYALGNIGYRWLHVRDSTFTTQLTDTVRFEIVIPPGFSTPPTPLVVWATDASGNQAAQNVYTAVVDGMTRPIQTLDLTGVVGAFYAGGGVLNVDDDRYYFATASDHQVRAVGLNPVELLHVATFGAVVRAVDLTPGGDSLVALLDGQPARLISWNVNAGPSATDTIVVTLAQSGAKDMRIAANGHALVTGFELVDVNRATRAQRLRTQGAGPFALDLAASPDRRHVIAWDELRALVYSSDLDTLGPMLQLFPTPPPSMPLGNPGPYVNTGGSSLNRNRLYDASLNVVRQVLPDPGQFPTAQSLSPDGQWAYIGGWPGYWKVDVQTGAVLERVILPREPGRLIPHPDGQRLIVLSGSWVGVVNLN